MIRSSAFGFITLPLLIVGCASEPADDGFRGEAGKVDDPSGWSHVVLGSADHVGISVDYVSNYQAGQGYKPTHTTFADPVYANVWGEQLTGDEAVRVVLMNYQPTTPGEACDRRIVPFTYALDLEWHGDHFSGDVAHDADVTRSYLHYGIGGQRLETHWDGYGGVYSFCQEIAIVVDGEWLVDPVSRGANFRFDMYAAR